MIVVADSGPLHYLVLMEQVGRDTRSRRRGRLRPEFGPGVRTISVENHVIYYLHDGEVLIARVLHGRRDQAAAWSESD